MKELINKICKPKTKRPHTETDIVFVSLCVNIFKIYRNRAKGEEGNSHFIKEKILSTKIASKSVKKQTFVIEVNKRNDAVVLIGISKFQDINLRTYT